MADNNPEIVPPQAPPAAAGDEPIEVPKRSQIPAEPPVTYREFNVSFRLD